MKPTNQKRLEAVYRFIVQYKRDNGGIAPTLVEIGAGTGITSKSLVARYLQHLVNTGRIVLQPGVRNIRVPGEVWHV
ncbi:MAG TPA: hypothetical protein PKL11_06340 [Anaerolineaceae bacterium]|jgi:SOS-response transcriptional repressor LexA|nr:hypothetical protein [Anaerolineaceae bacterium]